MNDRNKGNKNRFQVQLIRHKSTKITYNLNNVRHYSKNK